MGRSGLSFALFHVVALLLATPVFTRDVSLRFTRIPHLAGKFPFPSAAFTSLVSNQANGVTRYDLLLSAFGMFDTDVAVVRDVGSQIRDISSITPVSLTKKMKWPNGISGLPVNVLGNRKPYVVIPDGFLVPTKGDGSVTLQPMNGGPGHEISSGGDWFYHFVEWADMNKDGTLDAVTCRAQKPIFGSSKGQLVFFSNPKNHSLATPWTANVIAAGPDVGFYMTSFKVAGSNRSFEAIITAEYFNPRLRIFWTTSPTQDWSDSKAVRSRDIESVKGDHGTPFYVLVADLNLDGKDEIVVSFNSAKNGSVAIFEVPDDFRVGTFKKHVVATDYSTEKTGPGSGAPGLLSTLPAAVKGQKPSILVSGDDSGLLTILEPAQSTNTLDWSYTRSDFLHTSKNTIGGISVADVDGDGKQEIFVPSYGEGNVYVYKW